MKRLGSISIALATLALLVLPTRAAHTAVPVATPPATTARVMRSHTVRTVSVDLASRRARHSRTVPLPAVLGHTQVTYDLTAAERDHTLSSLQKAPAWVVASRLLLGEMGVSRLSDNQHGLVEAVAILQTVRNRLDPAVSNPGGERVMAWPGCGEGGTFVTCASPDQYLGLRQPRTLRPLEARPSDARRRAALDTAVLAWWIVDHGLMSDVTHGAVSFVHRCGGAAYGAPTTRCDRDPEPPDLPGATSHTGPLLLRGPGTYQAEQGRYRLRETARVDFERGHPRLTTTSPATRS